MIPEIVQDRLVAWGLSRFKWQRWWQMDRYEWGGLSAADLWDLNCRETVLQAHDEGLGARQARSRWSNV